VEEGSLPDSDRINSDYYYITDGKNWLYVKSDLFVMLVFSLGSDWAKKLFTDLFPSEELKDDVADHVPITGDEIVFNVSNEGQFFPNGIILKTDRKKSEAGAVIGKETGLGQRQISLPVVVRVFSKQIPLSDIDSIGETSEILLSSTEPVEVELLVNGNIIGKGLLKREDGKGYKLKITELLI